MILSAERELGIVAGLQDRVAQVYGGLVYMVLIFRNLNSLVFTWHIVYVDNSIKRSNLVVQDFDKESMDKLGHGKYTPMEIGLLPPLYLIYAENPSDSGKVSLP